MRRQKFRAPRSSKWKQAKLPSRPKNDFHHEEFLRTWRKQFPLISRLFSKLPSSNRPAMKMAGRELGFAYRELIGANDASKIWYHFERVHILTQKSAIAHTSIHVLMFIYALYRREWREGIGQVPRILLAAPSSLLKFAPPGNTGRIAMRLSQVGPIPSDLQRYITS